MQKRFYSALFCVLAVGACLSRAIADPTSQPAATQPATTTASIPAITWDEAGKHVGETVTVTGPVKGTHVTSAKTALILNVGKDYPDPTRFTVMINTDDKNKASADTYEGKNVTVTGKIEMYRKVPEIKVNPADVTVDDTVAK